MYVITLLTSQTLHSIIFRACEFLDYDASITAVNLIGSMEKNEYKFTVRQEMRYLDSNMEYWSSFFDEVIGSVRSSEDAFTLQKEKNKTVS